MVKRFSRQELAIQRAKKYLRSQGIMNKKDEEKMPDRIRKKMEEILKLNEGGIQESRIVVPKNKTVIKPEVFSEKSDSGVKKKGSKVTIGKKILGVDVIGQAAQQKYTFPRGESKKRTKSITASKQFGDKGSFGIEAYDSTSSNPMNKRKNKGFKASFTLNLSRGGGAAIRGFKFGGVK